MRQGAGDQRDAPGALGEPGWQGGHRTTEVGATRRYQRLAYLKCRISRLPSIHRQALIQSATCSCDRLRTLCAGAARVWRVRNVEPRGAAWKSALFFGIVLTL